MKPRMWGSWPPLVAFNACLRTVDVKDAGEAGGAGEAEERVAEDTQRAETGHLHSRLRVVPALVTHMRLAFLAGLNSPGFQDLMDQILVPSDGYRPEFDGTEFDVDLNEPDSGLS
ncbi:hypothetical protein PIB30_032551 [Stylosanthes scabra]|uniref:Uncharacterized protein n=1 Tax=Stylosanthes scabra TaxID=79078 RepID=A0ABU6Z9Y9_9FABA|nr:hypothetical protein [Stylosanthes scabra]